MEKYRILLKIENNLGNYFWFVSLKTLFSKVIFFTARLSMSSILKFKADIELSEIDESLMEK